MKILFLMHFMNRLRNFEGVVRTLAERGHTVRIGVLEKGDLNIPEALRHLPISVIVCESHRGDEWQHFARPLRRMRDALRYFHPRYSNAAKLRERAFAGLDFLLGRWLVSLYYLGWFRYALLPLDGFLAFLEQLIPSAPRINAFIGQEKPDILLISPLVQRGAEYQVDYIKGARDAGIPSAFLPFSWDNLSNKGLMRAVPDAVFVWNETQKWEAVRLHGMPKEIIDVCGAWRFDSFYSMKPKSSREEFCRLLHLDPSRPIITYLCSSEFTSQNEADFIRKWIESIRSSKNPALKEACLLIRPYPDHLKRLDAYNFSDFENVALIPRGFYGTPQEASWGDQELFDCLYHSRAVVGLNTSAMIEAAILSKPVHTILVNEFKGGQGDTIHFRYFLDVNGGLLRVAENFSEHESQLTATLSSESLRDEKSDRFIDAFVRPFGRENRATPNLLEKIERLAGIKKAPRAESRWKIFLRGTVLKTIPSLQFCLGKIREPEKLEVSFEKYAKKLIRKVLTTLKLQFLLPSPSTPSSVASAPVLRLDYPNLEIYIYATSPMEQKRRTKSCREEPWIIRWLEKYVAQGGVLYDIGANVGTFSLLAAKLQNGNGSVRVVAFEPGHASFARLCENIVLNNCEKQILPVPVPLSEKTGLAAFTTRSGGRGQSRHTDDASAPTAQEGNVRQYRRPVLAFRLDDLRQKFDLPRPTCIKLDVDGVELDVLQGADKILEDDGLRTLLIEVDQALTARVTEILTRKGFFLLEKIERQERSNGEPKPSWCGLFDRQKDPASSKTIP